MKNLLISAVLLCTLSAHAQSVLTRSKGNSFNPSIGINALMLYKNGSEDIDEDGFSLQELELQFTSDVDAYFRAEARIALHQEESSEGGHSHEFNVDPEEVFVETISIPKFTLKAGKFYANFGKYNMVHTHALPFIYKGKVQETMFGHEGLSEVGLGASVLAPLSWFSEFSFQILQPTNEDLFVESHHSISYVLKSKNLWDLSDSLTIEWGLSGLYFSHQENIKEETQLYGSDLTLKWKPTQSSNHSSFMWSTEFIHKERKGSISQKDQGLTSFIRYQLASKWYAQAQYEHLDLEDSQNVNAYTGLLAFIPTEFSSVRVQFDSIHEKDAKAQKRISLQLNTSIGAHPAHVY